MRYGASIPVRTPAAGRVLAAPLIALGGLATTSVVFFGFMLPRMVGGGGPPSGDPAAVQSVAGIDDPAGRPVEAADLPAGDPPMETAPLPTDGEEVLPAAPAPSQDIPMTASPQAAGSDLAKDASQPPAQALRAASPRELAAWIANVLASGNWGPLLGRWSSRPADGGSESADADLGDLLGSLSRRMELLPLDRGAGVAALREIGRIGEISRWEIPFEGELDGLSVVSRLVVDLVRGADGRWEIAGLRIPEVLRRRLAEEAGAELGPDAADPLAASDAFLRALAGRDWTAARSYVDGSAVSDEKLAALMIAIEDGGFVLMPDVEPLEVTAIGRDAAWAIAALSSPGADEPAEFGIEWQRDAAGNWKVAGLNFSPMIASAAETAGAGEIGYAPMVETPAGGESIVLYFPFNAEDVHPRAARQLRIIADLLRSDATKRLTIGGHADSVGSDAFNERLSAARARNVQEALLAFGVPAGQIVVQAFGERAPVEPNVNLDGSDNPAGRSRNRRAEVLLDF